MQCGVNEEYARCVPHCQTTCRGVQELLGVKITRRGRNVQHVNGNVLPQIRSALSAIRDVSVKKDMLVTRQTSALVLKIAIDRIVMLKINEFIGTKYVVVPSTPQTGDFYVDLWVKKLWVATKERILVRSHTPKK
ncbi:hypothetical protein TELCIR_04249 [Teladorsagia circumcincta]|uniref:Uncharacterized protein n=1 Tax=Teladorsagia circumcincta TaxID=45464 RepID=A0A2G9UU64_TELCI|nr:hypothetical protein TELCIR_04249 [Teladorsagia circumcincta]